MTSAWCAWGDSDVCTISEIPGVVEVPDRIANSSCMAQLGNDDARCVYNLTDTIVETAQVNIGGGKYPPLYYGVMRAFAGEDVARSVLVMRSFNVLLAAGLLAFALVISRPVARRAVALAWMACLVPTGIFFIASVNPSGWAITGAALFWAFLYTLLTEASFRSRRSIGAAVGAGLCVVVAVGARADSAYVIVLSMVAVALVAWPKLRRRLGRLWIGLLVVPLVVAAALFNVGRYVRLDLVYPPGNPEWDQPNALLKLLLEMPSFLAGIVGGQSPVWSQRATSTDALMPGFSWPGYAYGVGALDVQNPEISSLLVLACVGGVIFLGFRSHGARKVVAIAILAAGLVGQIIIMRGLVAFQPVSSLQPRYFFALVVVIISIAALTYPRSRAPLNKGQAALLVLALTIAYTAALMATMGRYTYGQAHTWTGISAEPGWWWASGPSPVATMVIGAVAGLVWLIGMARIAVTAGALGMGQRASEPVLEDPRARLTADE